MTTIPELRSERGLKVKRVQDLAAKAELSGDETIEFDAAEKRVREIDAHVKRIETSEALASKSAREVGATVPASVETDEYIKDKSLVVGAMARLTAHSKGMIDIALPTAQAIYGDSHPVTKAVGEVKTRALAVGSGITGGFAVPPDFSTAFIKLLYPRTVLRKAGARTKPMPNGTMTVPKITGGSGLTWVGENRAPGETGPTFGTVNPVARKGIALVPVSNDMMRYATAEFDAAVRDDLVTQVALGEDIAFIRSMGSQFTPKGLKAFVGSGQTIASNATYTSATVIAELIGLQTKLDLVNISGLKKSWAMSPRTRNYLRGITTTTGAFVFRDEIDKVDAAAPEGRLLGWPIYTTTQIPVNLGAGSDESEIYAFDANECVIYESRQIELAISAEGSFTATDGTQQSAFANDMSVIRAILAEDFQMDHDEAVSLLSGVKWSPTLS